MKYLRGACVIVLFAIAAGFIIVSGSRLSNAEGTAGLSWVDSVTPEITRTKYIMAEEFSAGGSKTNFPCTDTESYTRGIGSSQGFDITGYGCTLPINGASFDVANNAVIPYGTKYTQKFKDDTLDRLTYYPARNSSHLAVISNSYNFFYGGTPTLYLVDDWVSTYTNFSVDGYSNITRQPARPYDFVLKYANGNPVNVNSNGMSFSTNGEWMIIGITSRSHVLINMETKAVLPFTQYVNSNYALYSAVSNDGKYIALSKQYDGLKLYDTTRCQASGEEMMSRDCQSRDVMPMVKEYLNSNTVFLGDMNFIGAGSALEFKARWLDADGVTWHFAMLKMKLPGVEVSKYLAMGDSFSSGEGAFDYVEATDMFVSDEEYNVCHVSRKSYPYLLQEDLRAEWFHSVACSGSESKDVISDRKLGVYMQESARAKITIPESTLDAEKYLESQAVNLVNSMRPGYVPQYNFVTNDNPSIATISMGGNDVGFESIVASCVFKGFSIIQTCFSDREERESKANEIDQKISVWSQNFVAIKNSLGGSDPKLYVIGYPKLVDTDLRHRCGLNAPFDDAERLLTDKMIEYLNTAVKVAADAAGVRYVDVSDALTRAGEERLCGPGPAFAVNGLDTRSFVNECTSATAPNPPACPNSFHPNELGQKRMSETIAYRTTNLSQTMPQNSNSMADLVNKRMEFVGDVSITLQNHRITFQKDIAPSLIAKGEKIQINIPKSPADLPAKAGTTATATVHSTLTNLGQLAIAADGTISGELTFPGAIETGYHRLIVSYTDIANNVVEKYMYFYAAQSQNDLDGDGINNTADPCISVAQSGVDQDEDGIDDACDGEYVKHAQTAAPDYVSRAQNSTTADVQHPTKANVDETVVPFTHYTGVPDIFQSPAAIVPLPTTRPVDGQAGENTVNALPRNDPDYWLWIVIGVGAILVIILAVLMRLARSKN